MPKFEFTVRKNLDANFTIEADTEEKARELALELAETDETLEWSDEEYEIVRVWNHHLTHKSRRMLEKREAELAKAESELAKLIAEQSAGES